MLSQAYFFHEKKKYPAFRLGQGIESHDDPMDRWPPPKMHGRWVKNPGLDRPCIRFVSPHFI